MENITRQINSFLDTLITSYRQQGQVVRVLIPALLVLAFCCLCSVLIPLLTPRAPSNTLPSPTVFPTDGTAGPQATPTPLFNFDFPTFTPFPTGTSFVPTAFPTLTASPTGSPTGTTDAHPIDTDRYRDIHPQCNRLTDPDRYESTAYRNGDSNRDERSLR